MTKDGSLLLKYFKDRVPKPKRIELETIKRINRAQGFTQNYVASTVQHDHQLFSIQVMSFIFKKIKWDERSMVMDFVEHISGEA